MRGLALAPVGLALSACDLGPRVQDAGSRFTSSAPSGSAATAEPKPGGVLRVGKPEDLLANGIPHVLPPANFQINNLVFDTLVYYDDQLNPRPRLATSWEWSSDFRQLSFSLRRDVTFHSGRPLTSDAVRLNLERLRDPSIGSGLAGYARLMHVTTPAPDRVVVNYDTPARSSFDAFALAFMADPETLDSTTNRPVPAGTGPFRFQEWAPGDHVTVRRNPSYWQPGKPHPATWGDFFDQSVALVWAH